MCSPFTASCRLGFLIVALALTGCSGAASVNPAAQGVGQSQALRTRQDGATSLPTGKDQCKDGGWQTFGVFKDQGDCVSYVATGGKNLPDLAPTAPPGCTENATTGVNLGTDGVLATFAVLAGSTVTNTGATIVSGNLGVSPGLAVTGFPPGTFINGQEHIADAVARQAQSDLATAYNDAAGRTAVVTVASDLGGQTLAPGVYHAAAGMSITGTVTLDGQGQTNPVFIFQTGSTLITASSSTVALENGANWCNVFWQVGSSATLETDTTFNGTILSLTSVRVDTGATVHGRVFARNGAVTLDDNTVNITGP